MKESLQQNQELRLQQRLTPMQVQFVKMLEMTGPEIEMEVARAVDEMPALEIVDDHKDLAATDDGDTFNETADQMTRADYRDEDDIPSYRLQARNQSADDDRFDPVAANDEASLIESLSAQLAEQDLSPRQLTIAHYIIGNIDDNGYLKRPVDLIADDLAIHQGLDASPDEVKEVWAIVRDLDPAGVGAVDLRDCLLLQLRRLPSSPKVERALEIITHYFDLFSKKHLQRVADAIGASLAQVKEAVDLVRQLNPKPANQISESAIEKSARQIIPEFQVDVDGDSLSLTLLNNIPDLAIQQTFASDDAIPQMPERQRAAALTFIKSRRDEAAAFIKTLKLRQATLFRVMSAIVKLQREFFLTGDETKLKPMILKDVAAITGDDLSVISRATASKYVMTQSGVYPLKFFFNEKPKPDDDASFHQIAASLRQIIENEDKKSPLPDEELTRLLNSRGFPIARRTVSKYRERLGFPVARLRREC